MSAALISNLRGSYRFLPGIEPYSSGVVAAPGHEIVHVTLAEWMPWHSGLVSARGYLQERGLDQHALCAVELRCPEPHSFDGFLEFNQEYRALLDEWEVLVDGANPVARTNVAPVVNAPRETVLHAFSYAEPSDTHRRTFVVAGGGELPHRELKRQHIVRLGETSADAMSEKAECVVGIMRHRLNKLGVTSDIVSAIDVYTAHSVHQPVTDVIVSALPAAASIGVHWFYSRPPIREIEFEMDIRGVQRDLTVGIQEFRS